MLVIDIHHSENSECPSEWGGWTLHSFSAKHASFKLVEEIEELDAKLQDGRAYVLSYYEHGDCV